MTPRHPFRPGIIGLTGFLGLVILVDAAVALASPTAASSAFYIASVALGVAALIMLVVLALYDRVYANNITRMLAGEYWAHWRYLAGEWDRFLEQEQGRNRRIARRGLVVFVVVMAVLAVLYVLLGAATDPASLGFLILLGAALVLALVINRRREFSGERAYEPRHGGPAECYIGPLGVFQPNGYFALRGFNLKLVRVVSQPGNPSLLTFVRTSLMLGLPTTTMTLAFRVPVPEGRDAEARALAQRLRTLVAQRRPA